MIFFAVTNLLIFSLTPSLARAQSQDISTSVKYVFGESIEFTGKMQANTPLSSAKLFYQAEGEPETRSGDVKWDGRGQLTSTVDMIKTPVRAFSDIRYWFEVTLTGGQDLKSERTTFYYEDNRFEWRTRASQDYIVHWYEGEPEFAQSLLDVAELGLKNVQTILPLEQKGIIDIYAYASAQEMRATLQTLGKNWVGAHTDPDLGVMVVSLPHGPEQRLEMERQVPHELMHLLLYQWLGLGYGSLPAWLNEGMASISELYPNPDYLVLLDSALGKDDLLPIASLCQSFPRDASSAYLAYAEATSFTRYLHQQYGSSGLEKLALSYANGLDCERGIQTALGTTLTQLERRWRRGAFGEDAILKAFANLSPWLLLMLALLIPLGMAIAGMRKRPSSQAAG
jgi:hypothetical protein